jgi:hypothetical protein
MGVVFAPNENGVFTDLVSPPGSPKSDGVVIVAAASREVGCFETGVLLNAGKEYEARSSCPGNTDAVLVLLDGRELLLEAVGLVLEPVGGLDFGAGLPKIGVAAEKMLALGWTACVDCALSRARRAGSMCDSGVCVANLLLLADDDRDGGRSVLKSI